MAASLLGGIHQAGAELLEGKVGCKQGLDLPVGDFAREPIGAEQEKVANLDVEFEEIRSHRGLGAQGARDHIANR